MRKFETFPHIFVGANNVRQSWHQNVWSTVGQPKQGNHATTFFARLRFLRREACEMRSLQTNFAQTETLLHNIGNLYLGERVGISPYERDIDG
jgi:hypothetical protein